MREKGIDDSFASVG